MLFEGGSKFSLAKKIQTWYSHMYLNLVNIHHDKLGSHSTNLKT
jgi:hypothetical protein